MVVPCSWLWHAPRKSRFSSICIFGEIRCLHVFDVCAHESSASRGYDPITSSMLYNLAYTVLSLLLHGLFDLGISFAMFHACISLKRVSCFYKLVTCMRHRRFRIQSYCLRFYIISVWAVSMQLAHFEVESAHLSTN
jgi:hypothetical protein